MSVVLHKKHNFSREKIRLTLKLTTCCLHCSNIGMILLSYPSKNFHSCQKNLFRYIFYTMSQTYIFTHFLYYKKMHFTKFVFSTYIVVRLRCEIKLELGSPNKPHISSPNNTVLNSNHFPLLHPSNYQTCLYLLSSHHGAVWQ